MDSDLLFETSLSLSVAEPLIKSGHCLGMSLEAGSRVNYLAICTVVDPAKIAAKKMLMTKFLVFNVFCLAFFLWQP